MLKLELRYRASRASAAALGYDTLRFQQGLQAPVTPNKEQAVIVSDDEDLEPGAWETPIPELGGPLPLPEPVQVASPEQQRVPVTPDEPEKLQETKLLTRADQRKLTASKKRKQEKATTDYDEMLAEDEPVKKKKKKTTSKASKNKSPKKVPGLKRGMLSRCCLGTVARHKAKDAQAAEPVRGRPKAKGRRKEDKAPGSPEPNAEGPATSSAGARDEMTQFLEVAASVQQDFSGGKYGSMPKKERVKVKKHIHKSAQQPCQHIV